VERVAIVVERMEKYRPEVKEFTERILVIRQQYLVPWIPGPYQMSLNYVTTAPLTGDGDAVIQSAHGILAASLPLRLGWEPTNTSPPLLLLLLFVLSFLKGICLFAFAVVDIHPTPTKPVILSAVERPAAALAFAFAPHCPTTKSGAPS